MSVISEFTYPISMHIHCIPCRRSQRHFAVVVVDVVFIVEYWTKFYNNNKMAIAFYMRTFPIRRAKNSTFEGKTCKKHARDMFSIFAYHAFIFHDGSGTILTWTMNQLVHTYNRAPKTTRYWTKTARNGVLPTYTQLQLFFSY